MTPRDEQIRINLGELDFGKIQSVMDFLGWKWNGQDRAPSISEIATVAKACMIQAWESESDVCNMGGFEAEIIEGVISIRFVIERADPLSELFG